MDRHAGPPAPAGPPPAPEPGYAERARTLVHVGRVGTLATLSRRRPGHPFASVMPYALDDAGRPLFLISSMAMHTQNIAADPRASLLVTEPGASDDPLGSGRVTVLGEAIRVPAADLGDARARYLERHPKAAYWVGFEDFSFWRLEVAEVYFVGGFAAMDWIGGAAFRAATPDPLADVAADITQHMNQDHPDALVTFARVLAGEPAERAAMVAVDRLGFKLRLESGERLSSCRLGFPREVRTANEARTALIEMLRACRAPRPASP
jgi:putative heme iron utilization protein